MALSSSSLIARATVQLLDAGNIRWTEQELLDWLNQAMIEVTTFKPQAYVKTETVALVAGVKQILPADGTLLVNIERNLGTNGTTVGPVVGSTSRQLLDDFKPDWPQATAAAEAKHYMYDAKNPKVFYVYPPQPTGNGLQGYVEMVYCAIPPRVGLAQNIALDDSYEPALMNYMLYRAFAKDAEFSGNVALADVHYKTFLAELGAKVAEGAAA